MDKAQDTVLFVEPSLPPLGEEANDEAPSMEERIVLLERLCSEQEARLNEQGGMIDELLNDVAELTVQLAARPRYSFWQSLKSRKFLGSLSAALGIATAWATDNLSPQISAALIAALTIMYVLMEGVTDKERAAYGE